MAFLALAVFLVAGVVFGDDPRRSPEQVLAMFGLAALLLLAIVAIWSWLKRRRPELLRSDKTQPPPTLSEILRAINAIIRDGKR
jgi:uncharacterized iron-regulated membrane protein